MASKIPQSKGEWSDPQNPGNSAFIIFDDATFKYHDRKSKKVNVISGQELKRLMLNDYGVDRVTYSGNEPDFSKFADKRIGLIELESFADDRKGANGTYAMATETAARRLRCNKSEIEQYMIANSLSWHECGDRHTVMAIPSVINEVFQHSGGISIERSFRAVAEGIANQWGSIYLYRNEGHFWISQSGVEKAFKERRKFYRSFRNNK